jgi:hypothetical protein
MNQCGGKVTSKDGITFKLVSGHPPSCPGFSEKVGSLNSSTVQKLDEELKKGCKPSTVVCSASVCLECYILVQENGNGGIKSS